MKAYVETVPVEVTDGKIKVTFTPKVENPQICAIEIIPQTDRGKRGNAAAAAAASAAKRSGSKPANPSPSKTLRAMSGWPTRASRAAKP